ncbi:MAG TPA: NHLP bacteriocin export ABC transporter permease/ATPase subunit [Candidatus Pullichristensenella excrementigallinarum]|uniref:NHLP bacteriocin export ABC transporter permease/ATPase subunit n=1 Tax=Candidatus Pullichristensenella excrementigallinarum TaxID=2840907 RepID=A0A9D1IAK1_9FIRM|nr:NHLP bacteriocin export ABC transporter permease/ATPase subunit [Candidatus Pullichristensenella excrementigallinarum]
MGWFDEQIRQRIAHDSDAFSDAFDSLAGVVMGSKFARALNDERVLAKNAIDEILKYYRAPIPELPEGITDINDQLEYLLRPSGIMRRTVKLEGAWYKDATGAMLGMRKDTGMPVALLPGRLGGYSFFDVSSGQRCKLTAKTAALFSEEALCFYRPLPQRKLGIRDLIWFIFQSLNALDFVLVGAATLAVTLVGMLVPAINNIIYSRVLESGSLRLFAAIAAFLLGVTLSKTLLDGTRTLLLNRITCKLNTAVQSAGMMRLFSLPASFFKGSASGELAGRVGYINSLCVMLVESLLTTTLTSVFSLVYITQMARYGAGLVIPGMLVVVLTVAVWALSLAAQIRVTRAKMEAAAKESGVTYALISGVQKIRLSGAEKRAFARWAQSYQPVAKLEYDPPSIVKLSQVFTTCLTLIGTIVIYYFTIRTRVSLADYYAFNSAYSMVTGAFASLLSGAKSIAYIRPILDMVRPILEQTPETSENKKIVTRLSGGIELNNVSFRYSDNEPLILDNLSLKIRPGQYVAIVGPTGCGKSTLMRIMLGFETPQKGAVYYDGMDLASLDLKSLRRIIGTVMQNDKLFQGDIFSNIAICAPWLSPDTAWEAAEMAGIAEDIRRMPMGMHTVISEGSGGISGGQRQRLMIARAIAPKPRVLMFDEATSALDNITQKAVSESLDRLKCTRIVIAHRLSTIRHCDRILVLEKGRIVEDGSYDELVQKGGAFAELVSRQQLDAPSDAAE